MAIELKVPAVGESITEVSIGEWLKREGEYVNKNENVVTLESDKATVELPAPGSGTLSKILKAAGATASIGEVIGHLEPGTGPGKSVLGKSDQAATEQAPDAKAAPPPAPTTESKGKASPPVAGQAPSPTAASPEKSQDGERADAKRATLENRPERGPVKRKETGSGPVAPEIEKPAQARDREPVPEQEKPAAAPRSNAGLDRPSNSGIGVSQETTRQEEVVPMTRLRRTVAERLLAAQQTMALLTTFNEIDMSGVMALRKEYGEAFQSRHAVKLGFMSFFVKAAVEALKAVPQVNAEIRDQSIVYRNYFDIGVAIGGGKGLVVPVIRNAEQMSFAQIEKTISDLAARAKENKLQPDELQGGTFTITNGGIYGSLLSTPIVNPPQSGILGMHTIQDRPVARENNVVIRPMMYVALTYDHRLIDGREAVTFLKRVKETIETPSRLLLEI